MSNIRAIFENLYRMFMYKDELISLHTQILGLMQRIRKQDRVIHRLRANHTLSSHQRKRIQSAFRIFLLLKHAPFYRNGKWTGMREPDSLGLTASIEPIIRMFRLCDLRRCTLMLHDIEYRTNAGFARVIRSFLISKKMQSLQQKVHHLSMGGVFKRNIDAVIPYLGSSYLVKWCDTDIRFDKSQKMDIVAFSLPIRRVHAHVAFLHIACAEFCLLCGITDDVTHHALTECVLNTISISQTDGV
jgi:hypothetical protein